MKKIIDTYAKKSYLLEMKFIPLNIKFYLFQAGFDRIANQLKITLMGIYKLIDDIKIFMNIRSTEGPRYLAILLCANFVSTPF